MKEAKRTFMNNVVCEMYLNDGLNIIIMDDIQENLYKLNMDTMKISKYDDREALDDFLHDYMNATNVTITANFFRQLIDYALDSFDETDNDFYMAAYEILLYRPVNGLIWR